MQQIKIKIIHPALVKLFLENLRRVIPTAEDLMAGILGGKIIAIPGILLKDSPDHTLGLAAVIGICCVKIVDTMADCIAGHFPDLVFINAAVAVCGQAHGAEAQQAQLFVLKVTVNHCFTPSCLIGKAML